jgi:hypothetical protein
MEKYTDLIISANCTVIYKICIKINYFNYNYRRIVITKSLNIEKIDGWYNLKRQLIPEVDIVSRQYAFPRKSFATMTLRNICVQMTLDMICPIRRNHNPGLSSSTTYHRVCNKSNTTGATCGTETANISGAPEFTPVFRWVRVARSLIFRVTFCFIVCLFMEDVSSEYKNHSKKIWSYIKSKGQEWEGVAPLKNKKGYLKSDNSSNQC